MHPTALEDLGFVIESPELEDIPRKIRIVLSKIYKTTSGGYLVSVLLGPSWSIVGYRFYRIDRQPDGSALTLAITRLPFEAKQQLLEDLRVIQSNLPLTAR